MSREVDVLIVGGGLIGLSFAAALRHSGLDVMLLDGAAAPAPIQGRAPEQEGSQLASGFDARVSSMNLGSKRFLEKMGGWPESRVCAYREMEVRDGEGTGVVSFAASDINEPALGFIVENRNLVVQLAAALNAAGTTEVCWDTRVASMQKAGSGYSVTTEAGDEIGARLVVGADGGNSRVRELAGLRKIAWSYGQDALVTTVRTTRPHGSVARQVFTRIGPLAFLPLETDDQTLCSIVWSSAQHERLLALDEREFLDELTRASEEMLGPVTATDRRFAFPLKQQHLLRYVAPGLALIGDAAHTIHPLAGQGANLGLGDARELASLLAECRFSGQSPGDISLLRKYQLRRQPTNLMMSGAMQVFRQLYGTDDPLTGWLRNSASRMINKSHLLKGTLVRLAEG